MFPYNVNSNAHVAFLFASAMTLCGTTMITPHYSGSVFEYVKPATQIIRGVEDMKIYHNSSETSRVPAAMEIYNFSYQEAKSDTDLVDSNHLQPFFKNSINVRIKVAKVEKIGIVV